MAMLRSVRGRLSRLTPANFGQSLAAARGFRSTVPALAAVPYDKLTIGVPKETFPLERRVAQSPESVKKFTDAGFNIKIESGAGTASTFSDDMYKEAGAEITHLARGAPTSCCASDRRPARRPSSLATACFAV